MARSRSRASTGRGRTTTRASTSRKVDLPDVQILDEDEGMGIEDGIAIITTLILLAAIFLIDYDLGKNFGEGMFFK